MGETLALLVRWGTGMVRSAFNDIIPSPTQTAARLKFNGTLYSYSAPGVESGDTAPGLRVSPKPYGGAQSAYRSLPNRCEELQKDIKRLHSTVGGTQHAVKHREEVMVSLNAQMISVTKRFQQMRNQRIKLLQEKENIFRLTPSNSSSTAVRSSASSLSRQDEPKYSSAKIGSFFEDEDGGEGAHVLSPEEEKLLAQENQHLMANLTTMEEEVKQLGQKVAGIVELQEMFTEKVLSQEKDLQHIQTTVIGTTENVVAGNQQVRAAMQRNAGFRVWILFILLYLVLMPEGTYLLKSVGSFIPASVWQRNSKLRFHFYFQAASVSLALAAFLVIFYNKWSVEKPHFTTWHGTLGGVTVALTLGQAMGGDLLYFTKRLGGPWLRSMVRSGHALHSVLVLLCGTLTVFLAMDSTWVKSEVSMVFRYGIMCVLAATALKYLLVVWPSVWQKYGGRIRSHERRTKHGIHCCCFLSFFVSVLLFSGAVPIFVSAPEVDAFTTYGSPVAYLLYFLRALTLLAVPQFLFNILGLLLFDAYSEEVQLKNAPILSPRICFRTVTRGDYPELVKRNIERNIKTILKVGLRDEGFLIEVVTDKPIGLHGNPLVREIVVAKDYKTKSGALFKARALQYCWEKSVDKLTDNDWVVHMDEETLLTENSVKGILNFVEDGKAEFGQGLITYANENVVNWVTTLSDSFRVADDLGKLRFQFKVFHKPLFGWKGSYVVTSVSIRQTKLIQKFYFYGFFLDMTHKKRLKSARDSLAKLSASNDEALRPFDFIEGEMWEKSPFTISDLFQQRKRWLQGIFYVAHSSEIPVRYKFFLLCSIYSWATLPLTTSNTILAAIYPIWCPTILNILIAMVGVAGTYMYLFGVSRSLSVQRLGFWRFIGCLIGVVLVIPLSIAVENVAVLWSIWDNKRLFYVVNKDPNK
ncbi:unnamed protein product, partial [Cyprideis torosa]